MVIVLSLAFFRGLILVNLLLSQLLLINTVAFTIVVNICPKHDPRVTIIAEHTNSKLKNDLPKIQLMKTTPC